MSKIPRRSRDEDDALDGCAVEFLDREATPDAELPAASGGVEAARKKPSRRKAAARRRKKR